jgi:hypothetical protein
LIQEIRSIFPEAPEVLVLSIGTGLGDVVEIKDSRVAILEKMASESNKVAHRVKDAHVGNCRANYFRFNIDRGLQDVTHGDWEKTSKILGHTLNYVNDQKSELARCAKAFSAEVLSKLPFGTGDGKEVQECDASDPEKSELEAQDQCQYELMART